MKPPFTLVVYIVAPFNLFTTQGFIDPFRVANKLAGRQLFEWTIVSENGDDLNSLNDQTIKTRRLDDVDGFPDLAIVSNSHPPRHLEDLKVCASLRKWRRQGAWIGAISSGSFILAELGMLDGHKATVHFEFSDSFAESYPRVEVTNDTYVIDGKFMSCCGGTGSVDLALEIIRGRHGLDLANSVSRYIFHGNLRPGTTPQDPFGIDQWGTSKPEALVNAIQIMQDHIEQPLPIPEISDRVGISQRYLQTMFTNFTGLPPRKYFLNLRLARTKDLVRNSKLKLSDIAVIGGFNSDVQFSKAYKHHFGVPPNRDRKRWLSRLSFSSEYFVAY